jgi:hypothetical protein
MDEIIIIMAINLLSIKKIFIIRQDKESLIKISIDNFNIMLKHQIININTQIYVKEKK